MEKYLKKYVGKEYFVREYNDKISIAGDFPDEYTESKYTKSLRGAFAKVKANASQIIEELISSAQNRRWIENKKTTVWKLNHTLTTRDFWFITIPAGALLFFSVGMMTQSNAIIGTMGEAVEKFGGFSGIMLMICIFGIIGSFVLGLLDSALGTKKAMAIACVIMVIAGLLGALSSPERAGLMVGALICLALFMGASSNFGVSMAAQYWRREDFSRIFTAASPVGSIISSSGPMIIAMLLYSSFGYQSIFVATVIAGVISLILLFLFSASHVKTVDDKYRAAAGKELDDALVGRK